MPLTTCVPLLEKQASRPKLNHLPRKTRHTLARDMEALHPVDHPPDTSILGLRPNQETLTWIDVKVTSTGQQSYGDWITKPAGKLLTVAEATKFTAWRLNPNYQVGGRLIPARIETQGRIGPILVGENGQARSSLCQEARPWNPIS